MELPKTGASAAVLVRIGALDLREDIEERPYVLSPFGPQLLESELGRQ